MNGCACGGGPIRCGLAASGLVSKRCTTRTKGGSLVAIVKTAVPLRDASGAPVGAVEAFSRARDEQPEAELSGSGLGRLIGRHPAMLELYRTIKLVASSTATVLITGESGSGKDLVAEAIHEQSPRAAGPLVRVPCAAVDALLGVDGAVPPADRCDDAHPFLLARGGTLLLDRLADLTPSAQVKLRAFLEAEAASAADSGRTNRDVRVLCTTGEGMRSAVEDGRFRPDLYFRLNVFPLRVPPLREHVEDVPLIAKRLLAMRTPPVELAPETGYALMAHRWPGNVRELVNALEYAALRAPGETILPEHLPEHVTAKGRALRGGDERALLAEALARSGGSRTLAARALGISRVTLWKRMKKHGVGGEGGR